MLVTPLLKQNIEYCLSGLSVRQKRKQLHEVHSLRWTVGFSSMKRNGAVKSVIKCYFYYYYYHYYIMFPWQDIQASSCIKSVMITKVNHCLSAYYYIFISSEGHHRIVDIFLNVTWHSMPFTAKRTLFRAVVKSPFANNDCNISYRRSFNFTVGFGNFPDTFQQTCMWQCGSVWYRWKDVISKPTKAARRCQKQWDVPALPAFRAAKVTSDQMSD